MSELPAESTEDHLSIEQKKKSLRSTSCVFKHRANTHRHVVFRNISRNFELVSGHNAVQIFNTRQAVNFLLDSWGQESRKPPRHHLCKRENKIRMLRGAEVKTSTFVQNVGWTI